jgi:hypothetical protein
MSQINDYQIMGFLEVKILSHAHWKITLLSKAGHKPGGKQNLGRKGSQGSISAVEPFV